MRLINILSVLFFFDAILISHCELTDEEIARVDAFVNELVECRGMPGAAIVMVRVSYSVFLYCK